MANMMLSSLGGPRQRYAAFTAAMKSAKRADLAWEKAENEKAKKGEAAESKRLDSLKSMVPAVGKTPEEVRKLAYDKLEDKRQALVRASDVDTKKSTGAAIVVFHSVAVATSAATAPLGIENAWRVAPAPEPRDILWTALESADADQLVIDQKAATGERIKFMIAASWSIILVALASVAAYILTVAEKQLSGGVKAIVVLISGFVPGLIAPILMSLMVTILTNLNVGFRNGLECWSTSATANKTQSDFVFFLMVVGFFVPLLGAALITSLLGEGAEPLKIFKGMAVNVPKQGYYFTMILLVKMAAYLNASTRFVPFLVYRVMQKFLCKTPFETYLLQKPKPAVFAATAGWEAFAFLLACVYTQLSPYVPFFMAMYLGLQIPCIRLDLSCISKTPFATNGLLWRDSIKDTYNAMYAGMVLTLGVLLFSNAPIHFACCLPLIVVHSIIRQRAAHRFELRSIHGAARGRLPLLEASKLDATRDLHVVDNHLLPTLDHDKLYAPPHVLPHLHDETRRAYLPGPPAPMGTDLEETQRLIDDWESRYNHPDKINLFNNKVTPQDVTANKTTESA